MDTIRFGLIGYGAWGRLHGAALASAASASLTAIAVAGESSRALAQSDHPSATVTGNASDLLAREDVDAVSIVVPNALHETVAVEALEAGKHVLLEKPMALDSDACDRILAAQRRAGRVLNIGHELRLSVQWGQIKRWIDEGQLGRPKCATFTLWRRPFRSGADGWRYDHDQVGSWLLEELVHFADLIAWYFEPLGEPASVTARGTRRVDVPTLYDNAVVTLTWPGGAYATVTQCLSGFEDHKMLELSGTAGAVRATWSGVMDRTDTPRATLRFLAGMDGTERFDNGEARDFELTEGSGEVIELNSLISAVVKSIHTGTPIVSGRAGRRAVAICEAAERSLATGESVRLDGLTPP